MTRIFVELDDGHVVVKPWARWLIVLALLSLAVVVAIGVWRWVS